MKGRFGGMERRRRLMIRARSLVEIALGDGAACDKLLASVEPQLGEFDARFGGRNLCLGLRDRRLKGSGVNRHEHITLVDERALAEID